MLREDMLALVSNRTKVSRREFVAGSLAAGFALAVQPVSAQTMITTDTGGLTAGEVTIPTANGDIPAYRAMPANGRNLATILVVQEIFGVHEHIKDVCRRFAKAGWLAIAPEMYYRQGDVSKLKDNKEIFSQVVSKVPDAQVMSDLDAAAAWAAKNGGDPKRLGITGFCWGGRVTWLYAAHNQNVKAGVAWYGRLVGPSNDMTPKHPTDLVDQINAPVLGLYGGADAGIPNDTVDKMNAALKEKGKPSMIHLYPDTPHAFHADYRPSFRKEQAEDGWKRATAWFKKNGL
ncbi:MAG: dienelactone hydrolase family protein [Betaproteobacteria bacterium]|nr:dienelactone hydrolase family protein [Betaproteobacteria bacterium]MDH4292710.1 dienelactone hydrolase family protein [Betaproteobacteria bacterium]MDH5343120.1 dienelactone hydrolase family protein [Betaproteobacteria bacterium]